MLFLNTQPILYSKVKKKLFTYYQQQQKYVFSLKSILIFAKIYPVEYREFWTFVYFQEIFCQLSLFSQYFVKSLLFA